MVLGAHDVMAGHRCQVNFERQACVLGTALESVARDSLFFPWLYATSVRRKEKPILLEVFAHSLSWTIGGNKEVAFCCFGCAWWLVAMTGMGRFLANHALP